MLGQVTGFMDELRKICLWVIESSLSSQELAAELETDSPRALEFTSDCVGFLKRAGLIEQEDNGILRLPELMYRWIETKDNSIPIAIIHRHIRFIGELLAEIKEPKTVSELLEVAAKKYKFDWTQDQQVKRRCRWLMSAGMIIPENGSNRLGKNIPLKLAASGIVLLNILDVYEPDVAIFDYDELERKTREERKKIREKSDLPPPVGVTEPQKKEQTIIQYARCEKIRAWVLEQAGDTCELCSNKAPFIKEDGTPFLEIHHIVQLSQGGPDTLDNTTALCPNCHRHLHYGKDREKKKQKLLNNIKNRTFPS